MPQLEVLPDDTPESVRYTLADMARTLHLAESTARYYCKRFAAFIPVCGEGRRRRYTADAVEVMRTIAESMATMRSASAVEEALERRFPRQVEARATPEPVTCPVPAAGGDALASLSAPYVAQQTKALQVIALTLHKLSNQQDAIKTMLDTSKTLETENAALKREVQDLKTLLQTSEKVHQEDLQQIRDWMGRILRKTGGQEQAPS